MRKIFFIFSILALIIFFTNFIFASPPAPAPKCYIKGVIQSIEFKNAYNESCLTNCDATRLNGSCCPTDMELYHPDRYILNITIKEVSYIEGTTEFSTCEKLFPVGEEKVILINKADLNEGDIFQINQKIEGQTPPYWGANYLESYTLKEPINSDTKTGIYFIIGIIIVLLLITIIYFLRKSKK